MAKYLLNTEAMRVVQRNERGIVTYRKRYKKGDEVDVSRLEEGRLEVFLDKGTLVESQDDLTEYPTATSLAPASGPYGGATGDLTEGPGPESEGPASEGDEVTEGFNPDADADTGTKSNPDDDVEDVDQYSDMDYSSLQQAAKQRNLNAGGSAEDLRARLREDDES